MRTKVLIYTVFIVSTMCLNAQSGSDSDKAEIDLRKNSLYFEVGGNGLLWSINYDRLIPLKTTTAVFIRVGGSRIGSQVEERYYINLLGEAGLLIGGPKFFLDPGIGYTWFPSEGYNAIVIRAGGRFQGKNGLLIRLGLLGIKLDSYPYITLGAAIGYSF